MMPSKTEFESAKGAALRLKKYLENHLSLYYQDALRYIENEIDANEADRRAFSRKGQRSLSKRVKPTDSPQRGMEKSDPYGPHPSYAYYWFSALVPYTAFISGKPNWKWIGEWVTETTGLYFAEPATYWTQGIYRRAQVGGGADPKLLHALVYGSYAYVGYLRDNSPAYQKTWTHTMRDINPDVETLEKQLAPWITPFTSKEKKYLRCAYEYVPILSERVSGDGKEALENRKYMGEMMRGYPDLKPRRAPQTKMRSLRESLSHLRLKR